ncbi:MAG: type II toxin-antitoxin system VapC family toxin [Acidimicrobiia bacterium]|nr:type II toxin-antitoxin system VapC family toxin [Acidimicrobiia bacterium]
MLYLDTSAFLKLIVDEAHSPDLRRALSGLTPWSSVLLDVEAHRAGRRLGLDAWDVAEALDAVSLISPSESTFATARTLGPDTLRTLDALHLATALELGADLEAVVAYDRRLAQGCDETDIAVVTPGRTERWWRS